MRCPMLKSDLLHTWPAITYQCLLNCSRCHHSDIIACSARTDLAACHAQEEKLHKTLKPAKALPPTSYCRRTSSCAARAAASAAAAASAPAAASAAARAARALSTARLTAVGRLRAALGRSVPHSTASSADTPPAMFSMQVEELQGRRWTVNISEVHH